MKNKLKLEKVLVLSGVAVLAVAALHIPKKSIAGPIEEGKDVESPEAREDLERSLKLNEGVQGRMRLIELSQHLKMPAHEVSDFFREESRSGSGTQASAEAWSKLLSSVSASGSEAEMQSGEVLAETINAYMRLKRSGVAGEFQYNEVNLAEMQKSWTLDQRSNFARVLRRTAEIARGKSVGSQSEAFEKALDEAGLLEKYRQGCRK